MKKEGGFLPEQGAFLSVNIGKPYRLNESLLVFYRQEGHAISLLRRDFLDRTDDPSKGDFRAVRL